MVSKGDLVFLLDVDTTQYERGFDRAEQRMPSFEREMKRSLKRLPDMDRDLTRQFGNSGRAASQASGGYGKANRALLELSRGVEDASVVYGTMGLGGALRASANNISQFASIIHPAAGAVAGFGVAIGSILIPKLFETDDAADKAKSSMDALTDSISKAREEAQRKFELEDIVAGGSESIEKESQKLGRQEAEIAAGIAKIEAAQKKLLGSAGELFRDPVTGKLDRRLVRPELAGPERSAELQQQAREAANRPRAPGSGLSDFLDSALGMGGPTLFDPHEFRDFMHDATLVAVDDSRKQAMDNLTAGQRAALEEEKKIQQELLELERERDKLVKERTELEARAGAARIRETNDEHSDMRARDIEQAREEERELKQLEEKEREEARRTAERKQQEAERLAERQEQFRQGLTDDLDPAQGRERTILKELRGRRREIDELFGGDTSLTAQAEEAARQKLLGLEKPEKLPSGSPVALAEGSAGAIGLINRSANEAVPVAKQQLSELKTITARINKLIQSTSHPADLPPANIGS